MAAGVYKGLVVRIDGDAGPLQDKLSALGKESAKLDSRLKQVGKALKLDPTNVELLGQKQRYASQQAEVLRKRVDALNQGLSQARPGTEAYETLNRELVTARGRLSDAERAAEQAAAALASAESGEAAWRAASARAEAASASLLRVSGAASRAGSALTVGLTAPILGAGAAAAKLAMDYEDAFAGVRKTVDMTEGEYGRLYEATVALSEAQPVSAPALFRIEELGGQLGIANENLLGFAQTVSGLDVATDLGVEDGATQLAQFSNICGTAQGELSRVGSTLVDLGNKSATTESSIMAMAMRIAGAGAAVGMTEADVLGLAAALSSVGINAEAGGSAVSTVISNIDKAVALGSSSLSTWAQTAGMSAAAFSEAWRADPVAALDAVIAGMAATVDEGGNLAVLLEELGVTELRQTDMLKRLGGAHEVLGASIATANSAWAENAALQREVDARNDTTSAKLEVLRNRLSNAAAEAGGPLCDALVAAVDACDPLVGAASRAAEAFASMDEGSRRSVLAAAGLAASLGPAAKAVGALAKGASLASQAAAKASGRLADVAASGGRAAKAAGALSGALSGLGAGPVGLAVGLLAAAAGTVAANLAEAAEQERRLESLARGASASLGEAAAVDGSGLSRWLGESADEAARLCAAARDSSDEALGLFGRISSENDEMARSFASLDRAVATIGELAGRQGLSAVEQERLRQAVEEYNAATGRSVSVIDAASGELDANTDSVRRNAEAWKEQSRISSLVSQYGEAAAQLEAVKAQREALVAARDELQSFVDETNADLGKSWERMWDGSFDSASKRLSELNGLIDENDAAARGLQATADGLSAALEEYGDAAQEAARGSGEAGEAAQEAAEGAEALSSSLSASASELAASLDGFASSHAGFREALEASGMTLESFAAGLDAAGVDFEGFKASFEAIASANNPLQKIASDSEVYTTTLAENLRHNTDVTREWSSGIQELYSRCADETQRTFVDYVQSLGVGQAQLVWYLVNDADVGLAELAALYDENQRAIADAAVQNARAGGQGVAGGVAEGLAEGADMHGAAERATDDLARGFSDGAATVQEATRRLGGDAADALIEMGEDMRARGEAAGGFVAVGMGESLPAVAGAAEGLSSACRAELEGLPRALRSEGAGGGSGLASGLLGASGQVSSAGRELSGQALSGMASLAGSAWSYGNEMGSNFADGLSASAPKIAAAGSYAAGSASAYLHFSEPEKGPLVGINGSGREMGLNFAAGLASTVGAVAAASRDVASAARIDADGARGPSLTKADLYEAVSAALRSSPGAPGGVAVYVDGRKVSAGLAAHNNVQLGRMERRGRR